MLTKIFQMGWFNHQIDNTGCLPAICGLSSDFGATDERFFSCVVRISCEFFYRVFELKWI